MKPMKSWSQLNNYRKKGAAAAVIISDEPPEKLVSGSGAVCLVSQVICKTGALLSDMPLYKYIANLRYGEVGL